MCTLLTAALAIILHAEILFHVREVHDLALVVLARRGGEAQGISVRAHAAGVVIAASAGVRRGIARGVVVWCAVVGDLDPGDDRTALSRAKEAGGGGDDWDGDEHISEHRLVKDYWLYLTDSAILGEDVGRPLGEVIVRAFMSSVSPRVHLCFFETGTHAQRHFLVRAASCGTSLTVDSLPDAAV